MLFSTRTDVTPDVTLDGLPVVRQEGRPERAGGVSRLIRSIRQGIADVADESASAWLPRLRSYPY